MEQLLIPNPSRHDVVTFKILVDGAAINPAYQVLSLSITKEINRIPAAKIMIRDGEAADMTFEISNSNDFVPGRKITIEIGLDGNNAQVFRGIIIRHAVKIKENGNTELLIECRDEAVRMTIGRHSRYYENIKDNRLFNELIGRYSGLKGDTAETKLTHKELVQHHLSDWDFMLLRSEANAMLVNVNDGIIKISKPDTSSEPVLQVT